MVAKKRASKRQTLQQKFKIIKRTKQHKKKLKSGKIKGNKKSKVNDNRIPNDWPYKEELLKEVQAAKDRMEEVKQRSKEKRGEEIAKKRAEIANQIVANAISKPAGMITQLPIEDNETTKHFNDNLGQNSRRAYMGELRKVIESSDVILHVIDARDPQGTRSKAIEDMVLSDHRKKLVYILNKADLVPRNILTGWLLYLRKLQPSIPFKCNTQTQKDNLGHSASKVKSVEDSSLHTTQAVGAEELLGLLKNYCRSGDVKTSISVGIVGFPNVGKSSLINSLTRTRAVGVSSTPGFTKQMQQVTLDKNVKLVDSPGIVFADGNSASTALRNCVNVESLEDLLTPIQAILERCPSQYLMQLYSIPKFNLSDCTAFLALVARATGKLKKGGVPNIDAAARTVLHDWNEGRIKYYCKPPHVPTAGGATEADTQILSGFSSSLDMDGLDASDIRTISALEASESDMAIDFIGVDSIGKPIEIATEESDEIEVKKTSKSSLKMKKKKLRKPTVDTTEMQVQEGDYDFEKDFTPY
eukprot:CAMPEP_0182418226 /NCGR_PEP_ID=MMETSP1167-20130531/2713_1 /TAXON_ID=2988 /ORGANISM="Mallomonas Sp, Strain CCMP3275" /LENGTH=527 /DNA_ID=CAMNT_0024592343 /DNA_START=69 /DNA_END=1652 /DNA_ORIENTATION=-